MVILILIIYFIGFGVVNYVADQLKLDAFITAFSMLCWPCAIFIYLGYYIAKLITKLIKSIRHKNNN